MKKNIDIILKKSLANLGQAGSRARVSAGYAYNYLIPSDIAEIATLGKIKHCTMFQNIREKNLDLVNIQIQRTKHNLNQLAKITIKKKIGVNNQIFGSISDKEVLLAILECANEKLDKKNLDMPEIKYIGIYTANIRLAQNVTVLLKLQVVPLCI
uniref:Large ribosomal subunit protein bL9c n=1 Tax=Melanthalia intermedia TaxID=172989 RepID=A0A345UB04_9FLOR|nr:ribosomal protein L9 [Melanthalia intermedia]AXI97640.1 ribosomal protein L9 [Melanthalia intermedia]